MNKQIDQLSATTVRRVSERLNQECFCITPDREALCRALEREVGDEAFCTTFIKTRPHLFSNAPAFLSEPDTDGMLRIVHAIEAATRLPAYQEAVLSWAPEIAGHDFGPRGAFMGYDFHLAADGPKLIEVKYQCGRCILECAFDHSATGMLCAEIKVGLSRSEAHDFEAAVLRMFQREWTLQRRTGTPRRIAIVDDRPEEQYLYPEFILAQRFLQKHGIEALIADAEALRYEDGQLVVRNEPIDLVYNRLVDFGFEEPDHAALRAAYEDGAVAVTPNSRVHALYADKRNLSFLSDQAALRASGLPQEMIADLGGSAAHSACDPR